MQGKAVWDRLGRGYSDEVNSSATMLIHRREIQIEWGDCDPFGIVFFPRYFEYFDACTNSLFHWALGMKKAEMLQHYKIAGIPLVQANCNFLVPSSFGDVVHVESCVTNWGSSSFLVQHKLFRGETLAVEGTEKRVWTVRLPGDPPQVKGHKIPREVIEKFS